MSKPRKFFKSGYQHICQITADHGLFVYNIIDVIVLLSVLSVHAARRGIAIIALTIMLNHFHLEGKFASTGQMDSYMNGATSAFARMYNAWYGLEGQLFHRPFKNVSKTKDEKIKDTCIYIGKNGFEKKACPTPWDYRYNFLKYLESDHPFSDPIDYSKASPQLVKAIIEAKKMHESNQPLSYKFVFKSMNGLGDKERAQLTDCLISLYNVLDKGKILEYYGSLENLKSALDAVAGAEYDMTDDMSQEDYRHYYQMFKIMEREGFDLQTTKVLRVGPKNGPTLGNQLRVERKTGPTLGSAEGWDKNRANPRHLAEGWGKNRSNPQHIVHIESDDITGGRLNCQKKQLERTTGTSAQKISAEHSPRIMSEKEFAEICWKFRSEAGATDYEIKKFFHLLDA